MRIIFRCLGGNRQRHQMVLIFLLSKYSEYYVHQFARIVILIKYMFILIKIFFNFFFISFEE